MFPLAVSWFDWTVSACLTFHETGTIWRQLKSPGPFANSRHLHGALNALSPSTLSGNQWTRLPTGQKWTPRVEIPVLRAQNGENHYPEDASVFSWPTRSLWELRQFSVSSSGGHLAFARYLPYSPSTSLAQQNNS